MSEDLISKQTAIHTIMGQPPEPHYPSWYAEQIKALPSIQPERKKGKWIVTSEFTDCRYAKCNQCKATQVFYYNKPLTNFCPNCGADMRE